MSFWRLNWGRITFLGVLIAAIVVGAIVGGGTGTTITAIAGAIFAFTLFALGGGLGVAHDAALDRRGRSFGRSLDDDERERERRRD